MFKKCTFGFQEVASFTSVIYLLLIASFPLNLSSSLYPLSSLHLFSSFDPLSLLLIQLWDAQRDSFFSGQSIFLIWRFVYLVFPSFTIYQRPYKAASVANPFSWSNIWSIFETKFGRIFGTIFGRQRPHAASVGNPSCWRRETNSTGSQSASGEPAPETASWDLEKRTKPIREEDGHGSLDPAHGGVQPLCTLCRGLCLHCGSYCVHLQGEEGEDNKWYWVKSCCWWALIDLLSTVLYIT